MTITYNVYNSDKRLIGTYGREQLCDFATEQICYNKRSYAVESISKVYPYESKEMAKIKAIVRKVTQKSEYVATAEQSKMVLKVMNYEVEEIK